MFCDKFPMRFQVFQFGYEPSTTAEQIYGYNPDRYRVPIDINYVLEITEKDTLKHKNIFDNNKINYRQLIPVIFFKKFYGFDKYVEHHYYFEWNKILVDGTMPGFYFKRID